MNLLDQAIATLAPGWALKRAAARVRLSQARALQAYYDAARIDRTVSDWPTDNPSPDQAILADMGNVNARARHAVRNDWAGASMVRAKRRHVVGIGVTPKAAAVDAMGNPLETFNRARDRDFRRWSRTPTWVDVEGKKTLQAMLRLCVEEWVTTGNAFVVTSYARQQANVGLMLQMFETEQLADDWSIKPAAGNEVRAGCEVDPATGRIVAYWVHDRHINEVLPGIHQFRPTLKGRGLSEARRIPAERVLHLHRPSRVRETVGISQLAPSLMTMWKRQSYEQAELTAKKIEAFLGMAIKRDPRWMGDNNVGFTQDAIGAMGGGSANDSGGDYQDKARNRRMVFQEGMAAELLPGEEIQPLHFSRPGPQYEGYIRTNVSHEAAAVGSDYATVARDFSQGSYASLRQGLIEGWGETDIEQEELIDLVLRPIVDRYTVLGLLEGRWPTPGGNPLNDPMALANYLENEFGRPPRPWVDPAKEAAAMKIAIDYLIKNRRDILNAINVDWREHFGQVAKEAALAEELDIPLPERGQSNPTTSHSEPKVHGAGEDEEADAVSDDEAAAMAARIAAFVRDPKKLRETDRLTYAILADAIREAEAE